MIPEKKKILILTGDAGLGHRSAAEAVKKAFDEKYGDQCQSWVENPLNHPDIPDIIRDSQSNYDIIVKLFPDLYKFGYQISDAKIPVQLMESGFTLLLIDTLREMVNQFKPDLIITTYPMYMAPLESIFKSDQTNIPLVTVVTDLISVHHVWFNKHVTKCTVPTEEVRDLARQAGLSDEQIINTGIPVDPKIAALKNADKHAIREDLGWNKELTTLLVAGSPRIVSLVEILETLDNSDLPIQFGLVAGGNEKLLKKFKAEDWHHPAHFYDFIDYMPKLMRAADVILCKAGGLIVTESLASGLPLMVAHFIPGQEEGNLEFIRENNAGAYCKKPKEALKVLTNWLENDQKLLKTITENAVRSGRPNAAFEIAEISWELINI